MNKSFEDNLKSKYWEKFKAIFNTNILPQLSEIEKLRKKKIVQFVFMCVLVLIVVGRLLTSIDNFLTSINHMFKTDLEQVAAFFTGTTMLTLVFLAYTPWIYKLVSKNYAHKTKKIIANLFVQAFSGLNKIDSNFNENKYADLLRKSELVDNFQFIEVDDLYKGNYEGIDYTFSDTRFKCYSRGVPTTIYSGIVLHIKTSKPFLGHTKILEKSKFAYNPHRIIFAFILFAAIPILALILKEIFYIYLIGFIFIIILINKLIQHIKTKPNNININKKTINKNFNFTSSNKEEAKSLINKAFFEKLFELGKTYHTKSIRCAFFNNNIIIIIGTPEFDTLFKSAYNAESYKAYFEEIYPVFHLLHQLKNTSSISEYLK